MTAGEAGKLRRPSKLKNKLCLPYTTPRTGCATQPTGWRRAHAAEHKGMRWGRVRGQVRQVAPPASPPRAPRPTLSHYVARSEPAVAHGDAAPTGLFCACVMGYACLQGGGAGGGVCVEAGGGEAERRSTLVASELGQWAAR